MKARHKPLKQYALEIDTAWGPEKVSPHARQYLDAKYTLDQIEGMYHLDSATYIVRYFLANAQGFRGPDARRIKLELKAIADGCNRNIADQNHRSVYGANDETGATPIRRGK